MRLTLSDGDLIERDLAELFAEGTGVFAPLKNPNMFRKVRVEEGTLVWPGGVDLCPDALIWGGLPPKDLDARPARKAKYVSRTLASTA